MPHPPAPRYLVFDADLGGFNNIVMQFEIMVVLAWLTGRTLVIPPARPFYLLGDAPRSLLDFFDLDALRQHLNVLAAEEFLPDAATFDAFHQQMHERGHSPGWNAVEDVLVHPPNALTTRFELLGRLFGRRPVGITRAEDECEILYFPTTLEHRMFGMFETSFLFADPANERRARAVVRDAVRYRPDIVNIAEQAIAQPPLAGKPYSALHIRRGDFQYKATRIEAPEILGHVANIIPAGSTVYLATDETDTGFLRPFQERYELIRFQDLPPAIVAAIPPEWTGIVETWICAAAPGRFAGTRVSTFSARIATLRGHLSRINGPHAGIDTALYYTQPPLNHPRPEELRPYAIPREKHFDEHGETAQPWWESIVREPLWSRAYQAVWADTGD